MKQRDSNPWLSVILPTFNGAAFVEETLQSIAQQDTSLLRNVEVIVIDDGSSDATLSILGSYSERFPLTIHERVHRGNWVANTNDAMSMARGKYLCWLHQDDLWIPGRLVTLWRVLQDHPNATFLFHPSRFIDRYGTKVGSWRCSVRTFGTRPRKLKNTDLIAKLLVQCFFGSCATVFDRQAALRVGLLDEDLWYTADWDFWLKLAEQGEAIYCPKVLSCVRVHPGSQTQTRTHDTKEMKRQYRAVLDRHLYDGKLVSCHSTVNKAVVRMAELSADLNIALARYPSGQRGDIWNLAVQFFWLWPFGWYRFVHDTRILDRVISRLRAGVFGRSDHNAIAHDWRTPE